MKMKKIALYLVAGLVLILDFLALDDITTGNEPDHTLEYVILAASVVVLFSIYYFGLRKKG